MAEVVYRGPAPGNPFYTEAFLAGFQSAQERKRKKEDEEAERKRKEEEADAERQRAARAARTYASVTGPFDVTARADVANRIGIPFSTDDEGQQALAQIPASARLEAIPEDELGNLFSHPVLGKAALDAFGDVMGDQKPMIRVVSGDTPEGQGLGIPSGQRARVEFSQDGRALRVLGEFGATNAPDIVRLQAARDEAVARGDTRRAQELDRRIGLLTTREPRSTGEDQRERKIQEIMAQGLDRARAANIVDRNLDIQINPATGRVVLTDLVSGQVQELPVGAPPQRVEIPPGQGLYEQAAEGVTGAVPAAAEIVSGVTGQVGLPVAEDVIQRRQALRTAQQELIRALAINQKFPVEEMNRIREETNIEPGILDSPAALQARMRSLDQSLRIRLAQAERDANDTTLPEDVRKSQGVNVVAIRNFLDRLAVSQESPSDDDALIQKYLNQ